MNGSSRHPDRSHRQALLWYGVLAAPLAWAAQLAIGYFLEDAGCTPASAGHVWGVGVSPPSVAVIVICAVVAMGGAGASLYALRGADEADGRGDRVRFMATAGLLGSLLFALAILLSAAAFVPLSSCRTG